MITSYKRIAIATFFLRLTYGQLLPDLSFLGFDASTLYDLLLSTPSDAGAYAKMGYGSAISGYDQYSDPYSNQGYQPSYQSYNTYQLPTTYDYSSASYQPNYIPNAQPAYQPKYSSAPTQDNVKRIVLEKKVYVPVKEKIYVPIKSKRRRKKKMKITTIQKGFYIPGGTQLFGKYKSLKACQKACAATPTCFAGDFNPWLKKCYLHSNQTACENLKAHKKLIHFKKILCEFPEAPTGRVMLGVQVFKGIEQKGIKSLSDCVKKCASAGMGIPASVADILTQICYGIDYDFGTHRCYFHVDNANPPNHICTDAPVIGVDNPVPLNAVPNPSVVSILLCPGPL